jgi:hypothetical protein
MRNPEAKSNGMACGEALGIDHASGNTKLFRELQTTH